jgi:ribonuclease P/MRP protein subunit POP5
MVRIKHRYLLVNILYPAANPESELPAPAAVRFHRSSPSSFDSSDLKRVILSMVSSLFGEYGVGVTQGSFQGMSCYRAGKDRGSSRQNSQLRNSVKYFSPATSTAILRISRDHYRIIWAALTGISHLPKPHHNVQCVMVVLRVSGTIKKAEEHAIQISKDMIRRVKGSVAEGSDIWYGNTPKVDTIESDEEESDDSEEEIGDDNDMDLDTDDD